MSQINLRELHDGRRVYIDRGPGSWIDYFPTGAPDNADDSIVRPLIKPFFHGAQIGSFKVSKAMFHKLSRKKRSLCI